MPSRRDVLRTVGVAATLGGTSTVVSANEGARQGRPVADVVPFPDQEAPLGNAIRHRITWIERCGTRAEIYDRLREYVEKVAVSVDIEGVTVEDTAQYWSDPFEYSEGVYGVSWAYVTEPRPPGTYDFDMRLTMTEPYETPEFADCDDTEVLEGTIFVADREYTVTRDAGAGKAPQGTLSGSDV